MNLIGGHFGIMGGVLWISIHGQFGHYGCIMDSIHGQFGHYGWSIMDSIQMWPFGGSFSFLFFLKRNHPFKP
jgi:hypothetical protein